MTSLSLLLLILLLVIGAAFGFSSRRLRVARADHHHWLVRAFCALLATAALVVVGVDTWQGAAINPAPKPVLVSEATTEPPPLPKPPGNHGSTVDLGPCKLIATVIVARDIGDRFIPLGGQTQTLEWPAKDGSDLVIAGEYDAASYTVTIDLAQSFRWGRSDEDHLSHGMSVRTKGRTWSRSSGRELEMDRLQVEDFGSGGRFHRERLSAITSPVSPDLVLLVHLTRTKLDDPLRQLPANQWLDAIPQDQRQDRARGRDSGGGRRSPSNESPGIRMLAFMGLSTLFLLLAAIAGSAVFRRGWREIAFTALLAGMILYTGLLEFMVLRHNTRLATDAAQPEIVRAAALDGMHFSTFFHTGTAEARIRQIAKDPATTPTIRSLAQTMADEGR